MKRKVEIPRKKGALPSTVGAMLEATVHSEFTELADGLYSLGYLNQDQRIALSGAIGTGLEAFNKQAGDILSISVAPCDVDMLMCDDGEEEDAPEASMQMDSGAMPMDDPMQGMMMDKAKAKARADMISYILEGAKALYDKKAADYVWIGLSHNAWQDREQDIIPLSLIEADIATQRKLIKSGKISQYGYGLWQDHERVVLGDCMMREIVPGGRSCVEMGNLKSEYAGIKAATMSIGYWYGMKGSEYDWVLVYERSALVKTKAINARTFFSVKRRDVVSDAAMQKSFDELLAAAMEE